MAAKLLVILAIAAPLLWWLSRFDSQLTTENRPSDYRRRSIRCGVSLLLIAGAIASGGFLFIAVATVLAIIWADPVSELFARGFHTLIDSPDCREFDPKELTRHQDRLATLVREGRYEEAIRLCGQLRESAETSAVALDAMLYRLYDEMFSGSNLISSAPLAEADHLCQLNQCIQAESVLKGLLAKDPCNLAAGLMLLKLYAGSLRNADKGVALLRSFERQSNVPPGFLDYARHQMDQWLNSVRTQKPAEGIESLLVNRSRVLGAKVAAGHCGN